ncbi:AAA family ATPase [Heliobacterium undosum]|uniref:AAA family ATPase n=1 Tax=Heliomicrobium undosum TaxID=121734 RepID=A0A845L2S9_9FIRM|nr:ATP-binding protein [Heliomicrobium undosum]MZP30912.1 AAA family ATPase [Heliomicrobium undosum]
MLKEVRFIHWKSFGDTTLYIDPLTVLIGANASGKTNVINGLDFLSRITSGKDILTSLKGDMQSDPIRGGVEWATLLPHDRFTLKALVYGRENIDYLYSITVLTKPTVELFSESIVKIQRDATKNREIAIFITELPNTESSGITVQLNNENFGIEWNFKRSYSVLSQLNGSQFGQEFDVAVDTVSKTLSNIFVLDPFPKRMGNYTPLSKDLANDASNIAGVLAGRADKDAIERLLSSYASRLPECEIKRVWTKTVGEFKSDAMLYCEEQWSPDRIITLDPRGMSDGTLRFLGILTALLTKPSGSQIVIDEVDNGLHPSRAGLLLTVLKEIGQKRNIDVLVTTHNVALLNELGPELIPFVMVAHRESKSGLSKLSLLEEIEQFPKLLASGPLGFIVSKGRIEHALRQEGKSS